GERLCVLGPALMGGGARLKRFRIEKMSLLRAEIRPLGFQSIESYQRVFGMVQAELRFRFAEKVNRLIAQRELDDAVIELQGFVIFADGETFFCQVNAIADRIGKIEFIAQGAITTAWIHRVHNLRLRPA